MSRRHSRNYLLVKENLLAERIQIFLSWSMFVATTDVVSVFTPACTTPSTAVSAPGARVLLARETHVFAVVVRVAGSVEASRLPVKALGLTIHELVGVKRLRLVR